MVVHCSGPLFIVPQNVHLFSQNSAEYSAVCQSQKNNPKILEYFEFTASFDNLLIQQEKL